MYKIIHGGVTASRGFQAACCSAGIRYTGRTDMAMLYSTAPCQVAGTFTTNIVKAAPVLWDMNVVYQEKMAQAVVVNAGIANAATGCKGMELCRETASFAAKSLGIAAEHVLLGSTGVIGPNLPLDRMCNGIQLMVNQLSDTLEAGTEASKAIMTTDTINKECAVSFELPSEKGEKVVTVHLGGMSKGSGMIHPNMSTMLGYLTTDCAIAQPLMQKALSAVAQETFNMISVDGDTSTNDTLLIMANGLADNKPILEEDESYNAFYSALLFVCKTLAVMMARDGEGATKLIETRVYNADTKENAIILAKSVICSSLVKAMVFGKDANCGRILCALGYAGPSFDIDKLEVYMHGPTNTVCFYKNGNVQDFDEDLAFRILSEDKVCFSCNMNMGKQEATAWGCDLTYDYVRINGDYRS